MELLNKNQLYHVRRRFNLKYGIDSIIFQWASKNGKIKIVKKLLKDSRINPSDNNNYAIRFASKYGHIEIVKLLLNDPRIDPSDDNNYAIRFASRNGHIEIVKLLLKDPRVYPSDDNNYAIRFASYYGHLEVVKELLMDSRIDASDHNNLAIKYANENGYVEIVKILLKCYKVINKGNLEIIKKEYPFEYIYYKNLYNRSARIIQYRFKKWIYHPNSEYIKRYIKNYNKKKL